MEKHSFGSIVKKFREEHKLTMLDITIKTNGVVKAPTISKAEHDPNYEPRLSTFIAYYKIMDMSFDEWLEALGYYPETGKQERKE